MNNMNKYSIVKRYFILYKYFDTSVLITIFLKLTYNNSRCTAVLKVPNTIAIKIATFGLLSALDCI